MVLIKTYNKIVLYFVIKKNLEINFQNGPEYETTFLNFFSKLKKFRNLMIFEIGKFWKIFEFSKLDIFEIFRIVKITN